MPVCFDRYTNLSISFDLNLVELFRSLLLQSHSFVTNGRRKRQAHIQMPVKPSIVTSSEEKYDLPWVPRPALFSAPKASGEDEAGQVSEALQVNTDLPDLRDPMELKEIKAPREFRDLLALKVPRDLKVIQANLSQLLQLWHLRRPWS